MRSSHALGLSLVFYLSICEIASAQDALIPIGSSVYGKRIVCLRREDKALPGYLVKNSKLATAKWRSIKALLKRKLPSDKAKRTLAKLAKKCRKAIHNAPPSTSPTPQLPDPSAPQPTPTAASPLPTVPPDLAPDFDGWRVLPIRSQAEYETGQIGGEAEQHPHGIARSLYHPETIYLSHDVAQVWKSVDAGNTWKKTLGHNLYLNAGQSIQVDPLNPKKVFVLMDVSYNWLIPSSYEGIYRSLDGGDTWEQVLSAQTVISRIYRHEIAYDLTSLKSEGAQRWYAGLPKNGVFRSDDGGSNWSKVFDLSAHDIVYQVKVDPQSGKVLLASSQGLFISMEQGANFQPLGDLPAGAVSSIEINPQNSAVVYATIKDGASAGLYRSNSAGQHFSLLRAFDAAAVFMNPGFPNSLYLVGVSSNTITSHDGGASWITTMRTHPFPGLGRDGSSWKGRIAGQLTGIVPNPESRDEAVAFARATLWKTTDGGLNFNDSSTLFTGFAWSWWNNGIAFDRFDPQRVATFNCDVAVMVTKNAWDYFDARSAGIWQWYTQGKIGWIGSYAGDFQPISGSQLMLASVGDYFSTQLMRSTDEGRNWTLVTEGTSQVEQNLFVAFHPQDPQLVYAGNKISHDAGASFEAVNFGAYGPYQPSILGMCRSNPDIIYALDKDRLRVFRSNDRGGHWSLYHDSTSGIRFRRLDSLPTFAVDPQNCDRIYGLKNYDLASFDGQTWRELGVLGLSGGSELGNFVRSVAIDPNNNQIIYAGMFAAGVEPVFRSLDGGSSWQNISYNLPHVGVSAMAVNPHTGELLRGSAAGTWVFPAPYESLNTLYSKGIPVPSCHDGLQNGLETAVDAGGEC